jgi:copper ion binding protein
MEKVIDVKGMTCEHCVNKVKKIIGKFEGVTNIDVSLEKREARFECEDGAVQVSAVVKAISDFGYSAQEK